MSILLYYWHTIYNRVSLVLRPGKFHPKGARKLAKIAEGITDKSHGQEIQRFAFELAGTGARRHALPVVV
jgi:hypothetical protein